MLDLWKVQYESTQVAKRQNKKIITYCQLPASLMKAEAACKVIHNFEIDRSPIDPFVPNAPFFYLLKIGNRSFSQFLPIFPFDSPENIRKTLVF